MQQLDKWGINFHYLLAMQMPWQTVYMYNKVDDCVFLANISLQCLFKVCCNNKKEILTIKNHKSNHYNHNTNLTHNN